MRNKDIRNKINERLEMLEASVVLLEPKTYDTAIVGLWWDGVDEPHVVYDRDKILDVLEQDMSKDDAYEFYDYNTLRALPYMGVNKPIIIEKL